MKVYHHHRCLMYKSPEYTETDNQKSHKDHPHMISDMERDMERRESLKCF